MDVGQIFLSILATVSNSITALLSLLPNPDPFPQILDGMTVTSSDAMAVAYYWLDKFFIADAVITVLGLWFLMFPIAWIIMMLWKWLKAR